VVLVTTNLNPIQVLQLYGHNGRTDNLNPVQPVKALQLHGHHGGPENLNVLQILQLHGYDGGPDDAAGLANTVTRELYVKRDGNENIQYVKQIVPEGELYAWKINKKVRMGCIISTGNMLITAGLQSLYAIPWTEAVAVRRR